MSKRNKRRVSRLLVFTMDTGRVVLSPLILAFRVKKYYLPGKNSKAQMKGLKGALITANHTGMTDPLILNASFVGRRFFYTASEEVMSGFKGWMLKRAGCIKIDRNQADLKGIKASADILKDGYLLGMFPQGRIGGEEIHGGAVLIAGMADAPIIPAYIHRRKHWWQRQRVVFGEPVIIKELCGKKLPAPKDIEFIAGVLAERGRECEQYIKSLGL